MRAMGIPESFKIGVFFWGVGGREGDTVRDSWISL
jgi:hypothetical protein